MPDLEGLSSTGVTPNISIAARRWQGEHFFSSSEHLGQNS
jgi:hypothetical protein